MTYLLLVADPEEKQWSVLMQSDDPDKIINEIDKGDPSLRIAINTDNYINFDTRESGDGNS